MKCNALEYSKNTWQSSWIDVGYFDDCSMRARRMSTSESGLFKVEMSPSSALLSTKILFSKRRIILPDRVLGNSFTNKIPRGEAKGPMIRRTLSRTALANSRSLLKSKACEALRMQNSQIASPMMSSGRPTAAHSDTNLQLQAADSSSAELKRWPLVLITSSIRPRT